MDHRAAIDAMSPELRARLVTCSNLRGLRHLALHLGAITLTGAGIAFAVPGWPILLFLHGILLVFLFTLSHECTHRTPFRSVWLNDVVGHAIAPIIALPFIWFRYFHLAHHRHTNDPELDPELQDGKPTTRWDWLIYLSGWLYWRGMAGALWQNAFGTINAKYLPKARFGAARREAQVILALYALAAISLLFNPLLFWIWLLPVVLAQPVLRIYLLAEHGLCPPVANMLENSRTTFTTGLVRLLAWNMPYHAEHHAYPAVPFHQLPELHAALAPHLRSTSDGYVAFTREYSASLER